MTTVTLVGNASESFYTTQYTFHMDKYSCVRDAYFAHMVFAYLIMLTGIACFLTRIGPARFKWTHRWFGRAYIISMVWCQATSMLIHNTGLPLAVLWSFVWVLLFMSLGWIIIALHMSKMEKLAAIKVTENIARTGNAQDLHVQMAKAKGEIANAKTFTQRMFSLKALHGIMMFTSWINITGRIFASNQSGDFTCYTYPVYKPIDTPHGNFASQTEVTLVPGDDPVYKKLPWGKMGEANWAVALSVGPFFGAFVIGCIYTAIVTRHGRAEAETSSKSSDPQYLMKSLIEKGKWTFGMRSNDSHGSNNSS